MPYQHKMHFIWRAYVERIFSHLAGNCHRLGDDLAAAWYDYNGLGVSFSGAFTGAFAGVHFGVI